MRRAPEPTSSPSPGVGEDFSIQLRGGLKMTDGALLWRVVILFHVTGEAERSRGQKVRHSGRRVAVVTITVGIDWGRMGLAHLIGSMAARAAPGGRMMLIVTGDAGGNGRLRLQRYRPGMALHAGDAGMRVVAEGRGMLQRRPLRHGHPECHGLGMGQLRGLVAVGAIGASRRLVMTDLTASGRFEGKTTTLS